MCVALLTLRIQVHKTFRLEILNRTVTVGGRGTVEPSETQELMP